VEKCAAEDDVSGTEFVEENSDDGSLRTILVYCAVDGSLVGTITQNIMKKICSEGIHDTVLAE
jgi:hypothetical protein